LVGSSCIDKGLDIFNSNQNKKGGVLNKRIKQEQMNQVGRDDGNPPPPYDDIKPMVPAAPASGEDTTARPQGQEPMATGHGTAEAEGGLVIAAPET
jgi:hypothetical protein